MEKSNSSFLGTEPVGKLLLTFSVPCVLAMLVSSLYNIVDQVFIGQGVGYLGNAATNIVFPYTLIALAFALLIGDGAAALTSLSLGRKEYDKSNACVGHCVLYSGLIGIALTAIGFLFEDSILRLFGATEGCFGYAKDYFSIILIGLPFYIFTSSVNAIIRADGSPRYSMLATVSGAVVNLILDPIAIFAFHMGVAGAAAATVVGQFLSFVLSVLYFRKAKNFTLSFRAMKPQKRLTKHMAQLGSTSLLTQVAIVIVIAVANNLVVRYGPASAYGADIPLSAIGIVMKVFAIVISFSVGIAVGGQPIVGYNYGAKNYRRVTAAYRIIVLANLAVGLVATLLFQCFPQAIINLFGHENALYNEYALLCFRIYLGGIVLCCVQKATSIFLQSIDKPLKAIMLSFCRDVLFFVPALILLSRLGGVTGMLWAEPVTDTLAFVLTLALTTGEFRKIREATLAEALHTNAQPLLDRRLEDV
ncbi:MAG: MATE family efflux transporter [Eubacteriales bacterium]|nr:MATE family efflux transporter [Eubacteriales bacterium]